MWGKLWSQTKSEVKRFGNWALPLSLQYRQGDRRNILVFSSRRGGSTHLVQLIMCEAGMRMVDEPFNLNDFDPHRQAIKKRWLPPKPHSQFISLTEAEEALVLRYFSLLMRGGIGGLNPYSPRRTRTVFKILNAIPLIDWFKVHYDIYAIHLVRHPIPQAMSVIRNKWPITAPAYLQHPVFAETYLTTEQRKLAASLLQTGTPLEQGVLNWILENMIPLRGAKRLDLTLAYEELVLYPQKAIDMVAGLVGLNNVAKMYEQVTTPSWSRGFSERETTDAIARNDKEFVVSKWLAKLDKPTLDRIGEILTAFDVTEYRADSALPEAKLCHFRGKEPAAG